MSVTIVTIKAHGHAYTFFHILIVPKNIYAVQNFTFSLKRILVEYNYTLSVRK